MDNLAAFLPNLLLAAWLAPLASFVGIVLIGTFLRKPWGGAGIVATGAILTSLVLSLAAFGLWLAEHPLQAADHGAAHHGAEEHAADEHAAHADESSPSDGHEAEHGDGEHVQPYYGDWYELGIFGNLRITVGYYIDGLTVGMFCMVSLIASCIHFYATGYMHDELHDVDDHEVTLADGHHLHRPGRFHRFFQYLSLFCFSMLGLVIAGNIAMVFVFWELVGICSYFLIGFYIERKSASNAANKAFIVNRVGDFGMIVGLMALWGALGTFSFGGPDGIFAQVRPAEHGHQLTVPDGMVRAATVEQLTAGTPGTEAQIGRWRASGFGYGLLVVAGLGIFCGCVGKSAQFPLHVWLPDAMEGPTPVSALVHSATMVAAGVYLVGRFYPVFATEVLLVIAYTGGITLMLAATIAITATDIKRVLAYSTVSQLGYMMLSLGIGGWLAGLFHLITHAFFKSLLFLCSGSVIHACHTNEMTRMGGLRKKMPWTAWTMLVGCLAIAGAPFTSGFFSKDAIFAQAMNFSAAAPAHSLLFYLVAAGASITAFYMFRLWYMTFAGPPRDHHVHDHAHESPRVMYVPLVVLAVFAVGVGWTLPFTNVSVANLLEQARPAGTLAHPAGMWLAAVAIPSEHGAHAFHTQATLIASGVALAGFALATVFYGLRLLDPGEARRAFAPVYTFLRNKWYFDELYDFLFVRPTLLVSGWVAAFDRKVIDRLIDGSARWTRGLSVLDDWFDRLFVDGLVNLMAGWTYSVGIWLRGLQTGRIRQYVLLIVVGTVALLFLIRWTMTVMAG
jgi:NADH-quinone oxidoreductase subunit L